MKYTNTILISYPQDTLVDADVAINAMMWQNGGMSGLDHWNFVMHPVDAAMTCDPRGAYVRRWVPELGALPDDYVCKPWKCPPSLLRRAGVILGETFFFKDKTPSNIFHQNANGLALGPPVG